MLQAAVLALIHGIAASLPISSIVHERVLSVLFGLDAPGLALQAGLELGSFIAVVLYFGADWLQIVASAFGVGIGRDPELRRAHGLLLLLLAASAPIALTGFWLAPLAETTFRNPYLSATLLISIGLVMGWADTDSRRKKAIDHLSFADAMLIGVVQSLAVLPGASRMALVLTAALLLNFERAAAVRLGYLLALPVLAGHAAMLLRQLASDGGLAEGVAVPFTVAAVVSALASVAAMALFMEYVAQAPLRAFVRYRVAFGAVVGVMAVVLG